jgi:uncharacterized protein YmfQ (DUF2313 family)
MKIRISDNWEIYNLLKSLPTKQMTLENIDKIITENFPESRTLTIDEWEAEMDLEREAQKFQKLQES